MRARVARRGWGDWIRVPRIGRPEQVAEEPSTPRPAAAVLPDARRRDVEGLRGIAIALVVLYHSGLRVPGGFVGVDVFLVISGYLISGLLLRELERTGTISLAGFYGRRVRRLVPAAAVALTVTMAFAAIALPPLDRPEAMGDAAAAALSAVNVRYALDGLDYFSLARAPSPFLHFWSLSVEEQFYFVWPGILLGTAWAARRLGRGSTRQAAGAALGLIVVASLLASVVLTEVAPAWAFYGLPTRAWAFALGGLLAAAASSIARLPRRPAHIVAWAGAAVLLGTAALLDTSVPYPGAAALLPTLAAAAILVPGGTGGVARALEVAPLQFLGRISYSLYLWHWPLLVLPAAAVGAALDVPSSLALLSIAVVVAWASRRCIELPFMRVGGPRPDLARVSLRLGAASLALVVALSGGLHAWATADVAAAGRGDTSAEASDGVDPPGRDLVVDVTADPRAAALDDAGPVGDPRAPEEALATETPAPTSSATPVSPSRTPAPSPSGPSTPSAAASAIPWTTIGRVTLPAGVALPARVRPTLQDARSDVERLISDGCFTWPDGTAPARCVYGVAKGKVTVALIGDSHASHWFPALNVLANRNGWRLLPFVKASCPFLDVPVYHPFAARRFTECETWRDQAIAAVNAAKPDLVLVAEAYYAANGPIDQASRTTSGKARAMAAAVRRLRADRIAIVIDSPRTDVDIPGCLSRYPKDVHRCAIPRAVAFPTTFGDVERLAATLSGASTIDVVAAVCPSTPCPVVRNGMILYRDGHHLTATFVRSLAGSFGAAIRPLLSPADPLPTPTAPSVAPTPSPAQSSAAPSGRVTAPSASSRLVSDTSVSGGLDGGHGAIEPVIATHPTDPARLAVAIERRGVDTGCGVAALSAAIAMSRDGGRSWRLTEHVPTDASDRVTSFHSAVAWGPGPRPGKARLYWSGTTTLRCGGDLRVATAWSDDEGRVWSGLTVMRATPAWVGGDPDITVDRNPASPGYGNVWITYNYPLGSARGSGIRVVASGDFGRTWSNLAVPRAPHPAGFPATWRFASRIRTAPDGTAYVSWYQADLRRWDPQHVFGRGSIANAGSIGFAIANVRCRVGCTSIASSRPVLATRLGRNAWTVGLAGIPGAGSHGYADPMWSHGLDVDQATGTIFLSVGDVRRGSGGGPVGMARVGRSSDRGRTWVWVTLPTATSGGVQQSVFRPGVVVAGGLVVVGLRTAGPARSGAAGAWVGYAWSVSADGGATFSAQTLAAAGRWPAANLEREVNGPGTRDRLDVAADGSIVFALGDGRAPDGGARAMRGEVRLIVVQAARIPRACASEWRWVRRPL